MIVIGYVVAVIRGGAVCLIIVSFGLEEHLPLRLQLHESVKNEHKRTT